MQAVAIVACIVSTALAHVREAAKGQSRVAVDAPESSQHLQTRLLVYAGEQWQHEREDWAISEDKGEQNLQYFVEAFLQVCKTFCTDLVGETIVPWDCH